MAIARLHRLPRTSPPLTKDELVTRRMRIGLAYLTKPTGKVDPQMRRVWGFAFWLAMNDGFGQVAHRHDVEKLLAAGFHVAAVDVGSTCGSELGG